MATVYLDKLSYRERKRGSWSSKTDDTGNYPDVAQGDALAIFISDLPVGTITLVGMSLIYTDHPASITMGIYRGDPYNGSEILYDDVVVTLQDTSTFAYVTQLNIGENDSKTGYFIFIENTGNADLKGVRVGLVQAWANGDTTKPDAPTATSPSGGEVDGYKAIRFLWQIGSSTRYPLNNHVVQVSKDGVQWIEGYNAGGDKNYLDYPASRLKNLGEYSFEDGETLYWRVGAKTLFSDYAYSEWLTTTVRFKVPVLTPTTPVNESKRGNESITFRWTAAEATPSSGRSVELQYSYNQTDWVAYSEAKNPLNATIPAKYFNIGTVYWRVRGKNSYGDWGEWSNAVSFTVAEALPVTTAQTTGYIKRTDASVLSWSSSSDYGAVNGAEVEYYDDQNDTWVSLGSVSGTVREITVPGNTFPLADSIRWHVRSFNGSHEPGAWSENAIATIDRITSATPASPINGASRNEKQPITFQWTTTNDLSSAPTGADLQYRYADNEWQTLGHKDGSEKEFTADPDLFIGAIVYWRVRAYNQDGVAGEWSSEARFTTIDAPSVSAPQFPIGTIEDTDSELTFTWTTSSTSGTAPTGADVQYSYDGSTWETLGHTDGTRSLTVQGGTIHAGTVQWRVRSYNRNGTAGAWSSPATFVAHAAPRVLEVLADGKPFTMFTWQATDQQTYEIEVDGIKYGSFFGTEKAFQLPNYLEDGTHTVKVRVQNAMNIWSNPVELTFSVLNVPGESLHLSGDFDLDAELFWDDESESSDYLIYRDGKLIGETQQKTFADRVVLGEHTYYVINRFSSGYYSKSNEEECTLSTSIAQISLLSGGEWMPLEKSENAQQTQRFTHSRNVAYHHFSGDKNPTPEVSDEESLVGEFDAAWFYTEEGAQKLRSLLSQALIIKSRGNEVIIGVLEAYTKVNRKHFQGYAFNIHQMEWKDYICVE